MTHLIFSIKEEKAKTKVYDVISNNDKTLLGKIYWYGPWRQYVFEPTMETPTIWSDDCLSELYNFIHKLKEDRKGIISIDPYNGKIIDIKMLDETEKDKLLKLEAERIRLAEKLELLKSLQDIEIKKLKEAIDKIDSFIKKYYKKGNK